MSLVQGGGFMGGAVGGFAGSLGAVAGDWAGKAGGQIFFGALAGGVGAELTGGNFWQGAVIGGIVAGLNHGLHEIDSDLDDPRKPIRTKRMISKSENHSLKGSRGGATAVIPKIGDGPKAGQGSGIFVPSGSQSMTTSDLTYYDDGTVDVNLTIQATRINTTGSYIANYEVIGPNGSVINSGILLDKGLGINNRMDYNTFTPKGSPAVISTARLHMPFNSTIKVNVGLTYKIPMGSIGAITTTHIIPVR